MLIEQYVEKLQKKALNLKQECDWRKELYISSSCNKCKKPIKYKKIWVIGKKGVTIKQYVSLLEREVYCLQQRCNEIKALHLCLNCQEKQIPF